MRLQQHLDFMYLKNVSEIVKSADPNAKILVKKLVPDLHPTRPKVGEKGKGRKEVVLSL